MAQFVLGIGDGSFAQFGHHNRVALDSNFQAIHAQRQALQVVVGVVEALLIFRMRMVVEPLVVQQDDQFAQNAMNFLDAGAGIRGRPKRRFSDRGRRSTIQCRVCRRRHEWFADFGGRAFAK